MALADSTFVIRARFPERCILGAILRSNVIRPILRVARDPAGVGRSAKYRLHVRLDSSAHRRYSRAILTYHLMARASMGRCLLTSKCLHWVHEGHLAGWDITSHHD
jgi:hypothetical protein